MLGMLQLLEKLRFNLETIVQAVCLLNISQLKSHLRRTANSLRLLVDTWNY